MKNILFEDIYSETARSTGGYIRYIEGEAHPMTTIITSARGRALDTGIHDHNTVYLVHCSMYRVLKRAQGVVLVNKGSREGRSTLVHE